MFKYVKRFFEDVQIYTYNYFNNTNDFNKKYPRLSSEEDDISTHTNLSQHEYDDKQLRIDTLLFIKQYKNTYYKYTNKEKFNHELYNSFTDDKYFDGGLTAYDDNDEDGIRIFDKYILEYIKNRNDLLTYLQCKNKDVILKTSLLSLNNSDKNDSKIDAIFVMDMNDKELFTYCYGIVKENKNISIIKSVMFSIIFKHSGEYIRIKLNSFSKNKQNHPYLILESIL